MSTSSRSCNLASSPFCHPDLNTERSALLDVKVDLVQDDQRKNMPSRRIQEHVKEVGVVADELWRGK